MVKVIRYCLWPTLLIFIINTAHICSMEQEEKNENIMKILLNITPPLPIEVAKIIVKHKNDLEEQKTTVSHSYFNLQQKTAIPHFYFDLPCTCWYGRTNGLVPIPYY